MLDLVIVELFKEIRLLKRQFKLMKNNIEIFTCEELEKIATTVESLDVEIENIRSRIKDR
ncbi:MAG: hypothetical protein SOY04_08710 [Clostridium celatum]|nr:hypothetical protein [Clostridium celatum]